MADNPGLLPINQPRNTKIECTYVQAGTFPIRRGENKGLYAEAGAGRAQTKLRFFKADAKGPSISAEVVGLSASVGAELASVSYSTGPKRVGPCVASADIAVDSSGLLEVIDNYDRPGDAYTEATYARSGTYAIKGFEGKPGMRVPKAGAYAEAGVGKARAEFSVFEAEAKGPNASAGASANPLGVSAIARAELAGASAAAGPVKVKVGLAVDTGVSVGAHGLEAKVLGTGLTIGEKTSVSLLGNEVGCCLS